MSKKIDKTKPVILEHLKLRDDSMCIRSIHSIQWNLAS